MGEAELVRRMIVALRQVAAKCDEKQSVEEPDIDMMMTRHQFGSSPKRTVERDAFSRDWISGRLLGMADMAEALLAEVEGPPHGP